jgi:outer membrane receptor protein involved in Fe transport
MGSHKTSKVMVAAAVLALSALPLESVLAANSKTTFAVDIDPQPLEAALVELCKQGHLQLVISTGSLPAGMSAPLHGSMALGAALDVLLRGTGLTYKFVGDHTIAIVKPASQTGQLSEPPASPGMSGDASSGTPLVDAGVEGGAGNYATKEGDTSVKHNRLLSRLAAFLGICAAASGSGTACAQQAIAATGTETLQEVVVTGSRVITNGNDSPMPVTVVTTEELTATHPSTVLEALLDLPVFQGSRSTLSVPAGAGGNSGAGGALNLRSLGIARTLILYDGHRVPPTNQDGTVEVGMIPQMLLQRVDVVTGGASAVYGSDAIAGVVNFVTDRKFTGVKVNLQGGISQQNDDKSYEVGFAFGTNLFSGRGHFEGSLQIHDDKGLPRKERPFLQRYTLQGNGSAATPYFLAEGARSSQYTAGGKIVGPTPASANPLLNFDFVTNGVATPFVNGSTVGLVGAPQIGGGGALAAEAQLKAPQQQLQGYGRFDFDLTDNTHFFLTTSATKVHLFQKNTPTRIASFTLSSTNPFLASTYQNQLTARSIPSFTMAKAWNADDIPTQNVDFFTRHFFVNTGLEGRLGNYSWEGSLTHSVANLRSNNNGTLDAGRFYAALDSTLVTAANVGSTGLAIGSIACNVTLTDPGLYPGCVPMNVFGPSAESRESVSYISHPVHYIGKTGMDDVSGSITGAPFNTWAGPVNSALSAEYRKLTYRLTSDSPPANVDPLPCAGLRFNCTAGTLPRVIPSTLAQRTPVDLKVAEVALETDAPVIKDMRFVQSADINSAVRYASYTFTGSPLASIPNTTKKLSAITWKVGFDMHFNDRLTLRATRSRDHRAPNLNDLYAAASIGNVAVTDTLTATTSRADTLSGGNPKLLPEIGYTSTVGLVWRATDKLTLTVDGYDIRLSNAITNINGTNALFQKACYDSGGSSFYCTLQDRPLGYTNTSAANAVTRWYSVPLNIAELSVYGIDFEANYRTELFGHPFSLRGLATYQPHSITHQPAAQTTDSAGVSTSVWRATMFAHYAPTEALTIDWLTRWRSRLQTADPAFFVIAPGSQYVESVAFSNLNLSYRIKRETLGQADVYLNVQNLFNQLPPPYATAGGQADPGRADGSAPADDPIGRYFTVGVRVKL